MKSEAKKFVKKRLPFLVSMAKTIQSLAKYQASKRKIRRLLKERSDIFVEVGAGNKAGEQGWVTIDRTEKCDIFWDLRNGIPFPDASVKKIYSSHFFEHLSFRETQQFLVECKRVLVPGGKFSICVPNARIWLEAYVKRTPLDLDAYFVYKPAYDSTTAIDAANYIAYLDGEHKYMFDEENLLFILESKGFKNAHLRPFEPGLDMQERVIGSMYAEAEK